MRDTGKGSKREGGLRTGDDRNKSEKKGRGRTVKKTCKIAQRLEMGKELNASNHLTS